VLFTPLESIIKLKRNEVISMSKPIITHTITAKSLEEMDRLSHEWLKRMRGKIEILEMENNGFNSDPTSLKITYYYLDNVQIEYTIEELQYIFEHFHDALKNNSDDKVLQSIEKKTATALGWD
jgi:hypothetical protein